jgi:hypothetical protein
MLSADVMIHILARHQARQGWPRPVGCLVNSGDKGIEPTPTLGGGGGHVNKLGAEEATRKEVLRTYPVAAKRRATL